MADRSLPVWGINLERDARRVPVVHLFFRAPGNASSVVSKCGCVATVQSMVSTNVESIPGGARRCAKCAGGGTSPRPKIEEMSIEERVTAFVINGKRGHNK